MQIILVTHPELHRNLTNQTLFRMRTLLPLILLFIFNMFHFNRKYVNKEENNVQTISRGLQCLLASPNIMCVQLSHLILFCPCLPFAYQKYIRTTHLNCKQSQTKPKQTNGTIGIVCFNQPITFSWDSWDYAPLSTG